MAVAGQQHPQILNGRSRAAVIEADKKRAVAPQYIAGVTVTMESDGGKFAGPLKRSLDRGQQICG